MEARSSMILQTCGFSVHFDRAFLYDKNYHPVATLCVVLNISFIDVNATGATVTAPVL